MSESIKIVPTGDGSYTLLNESLNSTYHSLNGAIAESQHVFLQHGFEFARHLNSPLHIFEMGFGTGLNALLTWMRARELKIKVHYTAVETLPLLETQWQALNYESLLGSNATGLTQKLHSAPWEQPVKADDYFTLEKHNTPLQTFLHHRPYQVIYFDAFAPTDQPELWTPAIFSQLAAQLSPGGVLVTYCAKGQLRRDLKAAGLTTERLPGAPGKREMTRALRPV